MQQEEIEIQLWEYIDGTCNGAEYERISLLIKTNEQWKRQYEELLAFHNGLQAELVSMPVTAVFTGRVMHKITPSTAKSYSSKALNLSIKTVACFFIVVVTGLVGYAIYNAEWNFKSTTTSQAIPKLNWNNLSIPVELSLSPALLAMVSFITVLFALMMADSLFRKRLSGRF